MRISNISDFLPGADAVVASQLVEGSAKHWTITITDANGAVIDLTGATFEFDTQETTATVTAGRGDVFTISNFTAPSITAVSRDTDITVTNATGGIVDLYIKASDYTGTVPLDAAADVPIVLGTIRWSDGATQPTIRSIRVIIVIRFAVVAA